MGLYDTIVHEEKCDVCGSAITGFQTKNTAGTLESFKIGDCISNLGLTFSGTAFSFCEECRKNGISGNRHHAHIIFSVENGILKRIRRLHKQNKH
jgi:hypothetical protein